jgi:hypothetical protein
MAGYSIGTDEDERKNLNKPDGYKSSNRWEKKKAPPPHFHANLHYKTPAQHNSPFLSPPTVDGADRL